jgi:hypothetical protein
MFGAVRMETKRNLHKFHVWEKRESASFLCPSKRTSYLFWTGLAVIILFYIPIRGIPFILPANEWGGRGKETVRINPSLAGSAAPPFLLLKRQPDEIYHLVAGPWLILSLFVFNLAEILYVCAMKNITKNTTFFNINFLFKADKKGHLIHIRPTWKEKFLLKVANSLLQRQRYVQFVCENANLKSHCL